MMRKIGNYIRLYRSSIACVAALCVAAALPVVVRGETEPAKTAMPPGAIFSAPPLDVPGTHLVVVALKWGPTTKHTRVDHCHPDSVCVYVTQGILRLGHRGDDSPRRSASGYHRRCKEVSHVMRASWIVVIAVLGVGFASG